ncbi:MAG TPA: MoaD/ThiS family protein [Acidimicrobiia bacterium]|jgi:molybdopterin converting factor small subunit
MPLVDVTIPKMLASLVRSERHLAFEASTVAGALEALCSAHPELRVHIFDEAGAVRPHVSCFHNATSVADTATPLSEGDAIVVLQAVSGG